MSLSILIFTLNEEVNLPACLASVKWSDDIVVLDSYSNDQTTIIAESFGARVVRRKFDNWAAHQNWAMEHIPFKHDWVFYLDADERMTGELREEITAIARTSQSQTVAYYCGRRNYFMGRWIKHAMPPGMIMRLFRPKHVRFERLVNPTPVIDGGHGYLKNHLLHYNFSKGLTEWFGKHNQYSQFEATEGMKLFRRTSGMDAAVFCKDPARRRQAFKNLSFYFPARPFLKFLYLYFVKRGFLDGGPGLTYCALQSIYEYMIVVKMKELERKQQGLPV